MSTLIPPSTPVPGSFKGIALFTPGGDLVYCLDPQKQNRWHLQLCAVLQEMLGLSEPPHFLVPCYTATVDRWLDPKTQQFHTFAEASPLVIRHRALLNALFEVNDAQWQPIAHPEELCNSLILESYRKQFPELWQDHDLVVRFERIGAMSKANTTLSWSPLAQVQNGQGYVLRLFVSGKNAGTERILQSLHQLLETSLQQPYTLKVIDIHKHPEEAEADQVSATPTLLKVWPQPVRRIVGDLEDTSKLLQILGP